MIDKKKDKYVSTKIQIIDRWICRKIDRQYDRQGDRQMDRFQYFIYVKGFYFPKLFPFDLMCMKIMLYMLILEFYIKQV